MPRIKPVNRNQLDPETRSLLKTKSGGDEARWNVFEGVANNAATLRGIFGLSDSINQGLSSLEQEVVAIEMARYNGCGYCLPAHRFVCNELGVEQADIDAMTRGELLTQQPQLMVIQQFVRTALNKKGNLDDKEFAVFQSRGINDEKMIVILSEIAFYTFMNYFNRLAGTEIEEQVLPHVSEEVAWVTSPDR
ncbi:MAG: carboxymuconolactone decarboxylase family protein [Proteobacteria bacterium]|nr:carboxymuconolactone decarboxylase family protein [Pseudomonadota bacterium]MCH8177705.1 carboxymuconolactone decarboxylase family protein [Pseudomonadota bacterium]